MVRPLPPLAQLRSFEAAARFLSFKKAAEDLNVSPSAVSHAVQALESYMGVKLFHRLNHSKRGEKALVLTDAGKSLSPCLSRSFDDISDVVTSVMAQGAGDILTVATAPIFAKSWLMPRLHRFVASHPDVNIRVNSTLNLSNSVYDRFDVGLMYGRGNWPDQTALKLFSETMVPVCSPHLLETGPVLKAPDDLIHHTLIHSEARLTTWPMWLENAGVRGINPAKGLHFNRATLAIDAAMNSLGVALEGKTAIKDELRDGTLVIPFEGPNMPDQSDGYYLTHPIGRGEIPKVAIFREWVLQEAAMQND